MENHILEWIVLYLKMLMCCHWQKGDLEPQYPHLPCKGNESEEEWVEALLFQHLTYTGSLIIPWFALLNIPSGHELIWQWYWQISVRDYWQHHSWWVSSWLPHTIWCPSFPTYLRCLSKTEYTGTQALPPTWAKRDIGQQTRSFLWERWELLALKLPGIKFLHFASF